MRDGGKDNPGVITFPPVIYLVFLVIGLALVYLWPVSVLPDVAQYAVGVALMTLSAVIVLSGLAQFRKAGTNFSPSKPSTALVTGGPFRFSRNPTYLALSLLYVGIGIAADNVWMVGLVIPALVVMHYGVILREERYLERKFGEEYLRYRASVRRWL